jgi:3',5'-cyclic AMP phosphodiesterase CpdA
MRLLAISDLHLGHPSNRAALANISPHRADWLILAGDIGEKEDHLADAFATLGQSFAQLLWVPGNHELWVTDASATAAKGEARYRALVDLARTHGVITPEDEFPHWPADPSIVIAPLFTLYDYSFRPDHVAATDVIAWADEAHSVCADEVLLPPDPYKDRASWCAARIEATEARLAKLPSDCRTVLINHWPLEQAHAVLPRVPRFTPWCGTSRTRGWHRRFRACAVVYGHLHIRRLFDTDACTFHEVSLGYPSQWNAASGIDHYLRVVLPQDLSTSSPSRPPHHA